MKKQRLIAGTINHWPDDDEWQNWHLDISPRGIWSRDLNMAVLPDIVADIVTMPELRDAMFDEVRAHHVLEHLPAFRGRLAVHRSYAILKPGGIVDIEVPNMDAIADLWVAATGTADGPSAKESLQQWIYGEQLEHHEPGDSHRFAYTPGSLASVLAEAGFTVRPIHEGPALRMLGLKPE